MTDPPSSNLENLSPEEEELLRGHIDRLLGVSNDVENLAMILHLSETLEGQDLLDALKTLKI